MLRDVPDVLTVEHLVGGRAARVRELLDAAFEGGFDDDDWVHASGGKHFLIEVDGEPISHASVVERAIRVGDRRLLTGYLEAVATRPGHDARGLGSRVVEAASATITARFELGALSTGRISFYRRLGWERWSGPSGLLMPDGSWLPTPEDDGGIMILRTPLTPRLDPDLSIVCEWRPGDVW